MNAVPIIVLGAISVLGVGGLVMGDEDEAGRGWWARQKTDAPPVRDEKYVQECGGCHMAYQPGLLPTRSWAALMSGLEDHFGDNAELAPEDAATIRRYLTENAVDYVRLGRSAGVARSVPPGSAPPRISETSYFRRKHDEVPTRLVKDNPEVGSVAKCGACHRGAETRSFDEHRVRIPGYGRWDD
jgi:hypothetical protein